MKILVISFTFYLICQLAVHTHAALVHSDNVPHIADIASKIKIPKLPARSGKPLSPVVLIHGFGGTRIEAKLDKPWAGRMCERKNDAFSTIWLNKAEMYPNTINCVVDNLRLVYHNETRRVEDSPGVSIHIPNWGHTDSVEWLDTNHEFAYYANIAEALVASGYKRNVTLFGAPYDFRKTPNELGQFRVNLKILVESAYRQNGDTPVTLIAHSMGAPLSLNFLQRQSPEWKAKYVKRLISLGGAWAGAVKAVKVYTIGDDLSGYVSAKTIRGLWISTPALAWLMPSPLFWKADEVLVKTKSRDYTLNDAKDLFMDVQCPECWEMYKDTLSLKNNFTAPGVEVHCLYSSTTRERTLEQLDFEYSYDITGNPIRIFGQGDGTVNKRSLTACSKWIGQQKPQVFLKEYIGPDHTKMLADLAVIEDIIKLQLADLS